MEKIGIIGCGGHARSAADIVMDNFPCCEISFFDENAAAIISVPRRLWENFPL